MTIELRNRIWNIYRCEICNDIAVIDSHYLEEIMDACGLSYTSVYDNADLDKNLAVFRKWYDQAEWYRIYDFVEIYLAFLPTKDLSDAIDNFNGVLSAENAGYRVIGRQVVPITNEYEIKCIEQAQQTPYNSINVHLKKATELFSRRPLPDYENSIKESISAVEAVCSIITGLSGKNATLGKTIKKLKDYGVHIHPSMENAFSSMYGYTSDEDGIRHGGIDFKWAPAEDAKYMLVSCSAFVNYLIEKWSKAAKKSGQFGGVIMFAASTYEEIERIESQVENMEIVVFLFARPTEEKILKEFEYIHYNSAKYCSIYAIGYTDDFAKAEDQTYRKVDAMMQRDWYFSTKAFTEFKEKLQDRIRWNYSGETEVLVLQNNPGQKNVLNFQNYVAINVNKGIREAYIDSFQSFMESLIRSSKRRVTAKEAIRDVRNSRISVKDILAGAIDDCKKVPTPVKEIAKDRLFYRCANTMQ